MQKSLLRPSLTASLVAASLLAGGDRSGAAGQDGPGTSSDTNLQGPGTGGTSENSGDQADAKRVRFNFKGQSWDQVLDWFSRTTGLPIVREVAVPQGTVDYLSPRDYDVPEALRLLNILLQTQDVMLRVEADRLHLQKLGEMKRENIPTFTDSLPDSVTDDQIVTLLLPLINAASDEAAAQLDGLVAEYGSVTSLPKQNAVLLVETAGQVRRLQRIIEELDREDVENVVEYIQIEHAKAKELVESLKALMGERVIEYVINPQNNKRVKLEENRLAGLTLTADERTNSIIARGTRARIDRVRETIELRDGPRPGSGPRTGRTFVLGRETAATARRKLDQVFAAAPREERPQVVDLADPGEIAIAGSPSVVAEAISVLESIDGGTGGGPVDADRAVTSLPVEHLDARAAISALDPLLTARQKASLSLAPGPDGRSILVAGPGSEVQAIEGLLVLVDRARELPKQVRFETLAESNAAEVAARAAEIDRLRRPVGAEHEVEASWDADGGKLRLVGSDRAIERYRDSLRQAREALRPQPVVRQFRLENGRPSQVANELRRLAAQLLDPRDGTPFTAPSIEPVDALDLMVVTATAAQHESLGPLVESLDRAAPGDTRVRVVPLEGADPTVLLERAETIWERLLPEADRRRHGVPQIEVDQASGSLLLVGHREAVDAFEQALREARRLAAPSRSGRMLAVRQADASALVESLGRLLATAAPVDPSRSVPAAEITAVEELNSLWVVGEREQLQQAEQFLQRLDVAGDKDLPPLKLLQVRAADALVIAKLLNERYASRSAAEQREQPVAVDAEIGGNTLAVTAPAEILAEIESLVEEINDAGRIGGEDREIKIFSLKVGRAADLARTIDQMFPEPPVPVDSRGRPRPDLKLPREVVVRAHEPTNSLIVDAPGTRMEDFSRLVEQLDRQEAAPETEIRTYRLNRSRPEAIASTLRDLAAGGHLGGATDARGASAISIGIEQNTGSLVVSGPNAIFDRVEQVIDEIDGPRPGPATDLRIFRLASARADSLEPTLRQILLARTREVIPASAGRPEELLQLTVDRKTNSIVVAAPTPIVELAATLVEQFDTGEASGSSTVRVRSLNFADAGQVSQALAQALPGLTSPATGGPVDVKVVAAPGANAILLIGPPADLDAVEELIEPLDLRPSTDAVDAETFTLQYATATQVAPIVQRVLADQQQSDPRLLIERLRRSRGQVTFTPPVRVDADPRTNSLLVSGPAQTVALARTIIERLDVPDSTADRSYAIFTPERADPARLVQSADRVLDSTRPAGVRSTLDLLAEPQAGVVIVMGTPEETGRAETLLAELDAETPAAPTATMRTVEIVNGDPATIARTLEALLRDRGRWPDALQQASRAGVAVPQARVTADAAASRLMIDAPEVLLPMALEVVAQLDQPRGTESMETRVFTLQRASAEEVSDAVRQSLDAAFRNEPAGRRPTVVAESSSNSIVVTGTAPQLARIAAVIEPMDRVAATGDSVRTVFLENARAEKIAPILERLLDPNPEMDLRGLAGWLQVEIVRQQAARAGDKVKVASDRRLNAVILTGPPSALDAAERLAKQLDVRGAAIAAASEIEVVTLRNGDAASIAESLEAVFADAEEAPPVIRVDASGNALLVRGEAAQLRRIRELAGQLDRAAAGAARDVRTVALDPDRADAAEVARLLGRMLEREGDGAVEVITLEELLNRYPDRMEGENQAPSSSPPPPPATP
ncbi:MAG: secretin N-terminal domain-containing protein [Phycisphaerales bacterium]